MAYLIFTNIFFSLNRPCIFCKFVKVILFLGKEGFPYICSNCSKHNSHLKDIVMLNTVLICQQHLVVKSILKSHVEKSPPEENYIIM